MKTNFHMIGFFLVASIEMIRVHLFLLLYRYIIRINAAGSMRTNPFDRDLLALYK